jgi:hypothetical protein
MATWTKKLPTKPGIYWFCSPEGEIVMYELCEWNNHICYYIGFIDKYEPITTSDDVKNGWWQKVIPPAHPKQFLKRFNKGA